MEKGKPLDTPVDAAIVVLADEARNSTLAICCGAGISIPAGLPSGRELARKLHERFARVANYECTEPDDLLSVADAAARLPEGLAAVQRAVLEPLRSRRRPRSWPIVCSLSFSLRTRRTCS